MQKHGKVKTRGVGGRPRKYGEASRPVTVTLPESALNALAQIDPDRGKAIVKLATHAMGGQADRPLVEVVTVAAGTGVILVAPSRTLRAIPFLHLAEVAPGRYLLAMDPGHDFKALELAVRDVLDNVPQGDIRERALITQLLDRIKSLRQTAKVSMAEILFVRLGAT